jgi:hypothetical protein
MPFAIVQHAAPAGARLRARPGGAAAGQLFGAIARPPAFRHAQLDVAAGK